MSDFRFVEEIERLALSERIVIRKSGILDAIAGLLGDLGAARVGIQPEFMSVAFRSKLAKEIGARRLQPATDVLAAQRVIKDEVEIALLRKAVRLQERALEKTLEDGLAGQTELEIAARLEYEMKVAGAEGLSFATIVAAGPNGSLPHAVPGHRRVRRNSPLLIDWGARLDGYCADMTRTFAIGRWPRRLRDVYPVVLEAHDAAVDAIRPGRTCAEIDHAARCIIEAAGYGPQFGHALGHGIGLDVHEQPRLAREIEKSLRPGMVVTIEPGVYIPGVGGIRIEDDVLVTPTGAKRLSSLPRDIEWATLHD